MNENRIHFLDEFISQSFEQMYTTITFLGLKIYLFI